MTRQRRPPRAPGQVTAVVPVKALARAKSRLSLPDRQRQALALAIALDTVTALNSCPEVAAVVVVTADPTVASVARRLPVQVVPDDADGLDAAVAAGVAVATTQRPGDGVLVVPADLPCLRAVDVTEVLALAYGASSGAFVPDRPGTGTTMVVQGAGGHAITRYGPGSAARHADLGMRALHDAPLRARHDVDTVDDLHRATALGLGASTTAVVAAGGGWSGWLAG